MNGQFSENAFKTDTGALLPGVAADLYQELLDSLLTQTGLHTLQICEAASYSMAMVIRAALGLTAAGGHVSALIGDGLAGWASAAAVRHLVNAGTECQIVLIEPPPALSAELENQLYPLVKMGVRILEWKAVDALGHLVELISSGHNTICGLWQPGDLPAHIIQVIEALNEIQTPVHCVQAPLGIDVNTGARSKHPLFASSTLSLGLPFQGLRAGSEFVGRHYLCDISFTKEHYQKCGSNLGPIFAEQPVLRISPVVNSAP